MKIAPPESSCSAELLARTLLNVWLSGDRRRLRTELDKVTLMPLPAETDRDFECMDLLKCVAWRMKDSGEILTLCAESPQVRVWFDLLRHLAARSG